jgi:putative transposase
MPQSLVKILAHIIFSTKNRNNLITPEIEPDLFGYMHGIIENNKSKLLLANGSSDHVHLLVSLGKTISISELIGDIKRDTSKWIKPKGREFRDFYWRVGYGAFSVGQSQVKQVIRYIEQQKEHHIKKSFKTEYRSILKRYEIEFDERYVWD